MHRARAATVDEQTDRIAVSFRRGNRKAVVHNCKNIGLLCNRSTYL
jgi:hypothetical protein